MSIHTSARVHGLFAVLFIALVSALTWVGWNRYSRRNQVDFSRDIRPIFNQNCAACHGGVRQKAGVSFSFREDALGRGKSGRPTVVPGDPDASELIARVSSNDPETRMPYHGPALPPAQIALLRRWIKQGAKWTDYWAFVPPKAQPLPSVKLSDWVRQPLDRFVLARLEQESLKPSLEADKSALMRRVSLDLTGLPPTLQEIAAFENDRSPDAYEKQVDRLLASPAYGERWASMWLDLARYADSMGYEADQPRTGVYAYRDWVVDALNRNVPYDNFVTTQIAGDLLPNATYQDRIATSFHRQTPNNQEGGTDDEEFRIVEVMDRVATTWSVLNGVTMNCVQCHSHPYDPIRHADYYKTFAFFNTSNDTDRDDDFPNLRYAKNSKQYDEVAQGEQETASLTHSIEASDRPLVEKTEWKPMPIQSAAANDVRALEERLPLDVAYLSEILKQKDSPKELKAQDYANQVANVGNVRKRLAAARARGGPAKTFRIRDGMAIADAEIPGQSYYELVAAVPLPLVTAIRIEVPPAEPDKARHTPEDGFIIEQTDAWALAPNHAKAKIRFRSFVYDSEENLAASATPELNKKKKYEKKKGEGGFSAYPKLFRTRWMVAIPEEPLRLTPGSRIELSLKQMSEIDYKPGLAKQLRFSVSGDPAWSSLNQDSVRAKALARLNDLELKLAKIPTVNVPIISEEEPYERRVTLEFERGNFLNKVGPNLSPDVPGIFAEIPNDAPRNRLTLAKWFFSPGQPLTARVAVNRYWEQLFGTGLVETLENFGSVGESPSHPELMDWLSLHFQNDLHWDMKALLRELVTSSTYRQSAVSTPALTTKDPRNRLLARGPQQRLTSEMVRDQALLASGLLNRTMGGKPVMPPQPDGVWNSVYNRDKWIDAKGPNRFRRAIYTFVKRTSGYPSLQIFDGSDRETSLPRRIPTNTPLQALVTLNDPVYQEAAAALAARAVREVTANGAGSGEDSTRDARLACEFRLVLSREPSTDELAVLRGLYTRVISRPGQAKLKEASFTIRQPIAGDRISKEEFQALRAVGNVVFNLDGALNR